MKSVAVTAVALFLACLSVGTLLGAVWLALVEGRFHPELMVVTVLLGAPAAVLLVWRLSGEDG